MKILYRGVDVSSFQGNIDWKLVKESGISFAMIRLGFRGYGTSGTINIDKCFIANINGCHEQNIAIGIYFFSQALNESEAINEANFVISKLKENNMLSWVTLPVVFDFEGYNNKSQRVYGISKAQRTKNCLAFNKVIKSNGLKTMSYGSQGNIRTTYNLDEIDGYIWCAKYAGGYKTVTCEEKYFPNIGNYSSRIAMWQYSSIGKVNGINAKVDVDNMYIDLIHNVNVCPYDKPVKLVKYTLTGWRKVDDDVKWLQWQLNKYGYKLTVDGRFGVKTKNALLDFQANNNLATDCKCGPLTKDKLTGG